MVGFRTRRDGRVFPVQEARNSAVTPTITKTKSVFNQANPSRVDKEQARELELFYENDQELDRLSNAWVLNFQRKMKRGAYDSSLAIKGIQNNFVPRVITKYNKQFGSIGAVNADTKRELAENWVSDFESREG